MLGRQGFRKLQGVLDGFAGQRGALAVKHQ